MNRCVEPLWLWHGMVFTVVTAIERRKCGYDAMTLMSRLQGGRSRAVEM
jgi:hypothetical protein